MIGKCHSRIHLFMGPFLKSHTKRKIGANSEADKELTASELPVLVPSDCCAESSWRQGLAKALLLWNFKGWLLGLDWEDKGFWSKATRSNTKQTKSKWKNESEANLTKKNKLEKWITINKFMLKIIPGRKIFGNWSLRAARKLSIIPLHAYPTKRRHTKPETQIGAFEKEKERCTGMFPTEMAQWQLNKKTWTTSTPQQFFLACFTARIFGPLHYLKPVS